MEQHKALFFSIRDIFNMTISAAMATMMRLAEKWHKSELARQEADKERTKAELSNLRSQIKPHFMLNTLNNIYALTAFSPERAQKAIEQLSVLLRHILYENEQSEISIKDEIEFISNYISLMQLRVTNNVKVNFVTNIQEGCNAMIAPMIFISLVENAFKHGISPTKPSFIDISVTADNDTINCNIINSNFPKYADDKSGHGIGLKQVTKRLELAYSGRYKWVKGVSEDGMTYSSKIEILYKNNINHQKKLLYYDTKLCNH
ncbi:MAG: sensor histidine kinase [Prevotellaceae bacterium]|nr:sensor histidine kinase [Prevotellaceae bacterium]